MRPKLVNFGAEMQFLTKWALLLNLGLFTPLWMVKLLKRELYYI
jgi:hypothetical protein